MSFFSFLFLFFNLDCDCLGMGYALSRLAQSPGPALPTLCPHYRRLGLSSPDYLPSLPYCTNKDSLELSREGQRGSG